MNVQKIEGQKKLELDIFNIYQFISKSNSWTKPELSERFKIEKCRLNRILGIVKRLYDLEINKIGRMSEETYFKAIKSFKKQ